MAKVITNSIINNLNLRKMFRSTIITLLLVVAGFTASAKKIHIDETVSSLDGCEWHITGWIDVDVVFGWPPVEITGYDITMSGPCGNHHFQGGARVSPGGGGVTYYEPRLVNMDTGDQMELHQLPQLDEIIIYLDGAYNEYE